MSHFIVSDIIATRRVITTTNHKKTKFVGLHCKVGRSLDQTHRSGHHQPQKHRSYDQKHGDSNRAILAKQL